MDVKESESTPLAERDRKAKIRQASRYADDQKNPCLKESDMSFKCMHDNNFDRDLCATYFLNYKNCNDFWVRVKRDRKVNRIEPNLPQPEDRERVKLEYYRKWSS